ncbi:TadE family protein [Pectinatus sottacetonis]|uniref:TadE family protein n=1 Tax=Pectinatus sottacetonis TaxID=1002795 RepID=UPI0018C71EBE|nr:TadE family protein [Pectinatus sottacetonis]
MARVLFSLFKKWCDLMKQWQKGQSIVELAFVLPMFLLFFLGIAYLGMIFADYLTLSEIARDSARYAAVMPADTTAAQIRGRYSDRKLPASLYKWDYSSGADFAVVLDQGAAGDKFVEVTLKAEINNNQNVFSLVLPAELSASCKMRREAQ